MKIFAAWPYFACMAVLLAISALPVFRSADMPPSPRGDRVSALDGLRGVLALAVFFHHAQIYDAFLRGRPWALPPSVFYSRLGEWAVWLFFMLTGYLFWGRVIAERGRVDWLRLYIGRLFRIAPVYLVAVAGMLAIVFASTGLRLNVPPHDLADQVGSWLALGYRSAPDVNGFHGTNLVLVGVTWTLHYEWLFYAALLLTAQAARQSWTHLAFGAGGLLVCLCNLHWEFLPLWPLTALAWTLFMAGMTCASVHERGFVPKLPDWMASLLVLTFLATAFATKPGTILAVQIILIAPAFLLISTGCTVFGLLTSRPARRLGNVSYGVYLLQGLVLWLAFSLHLSRVAALASAVGHWAMVLLCAVLLVMVATLVHVALERPGIELGKRIGLALSARSQAWRRKMLVAAAGKVS